jgi:hypothetical protein
MKQSRDFKNQNPKLYGYGSLEQLLADPARFGDDTEHPQTHWVVIKDADGDVRFVPCTEEYFHRHRNEERNEQRRKDIESRCLIPSERFGLVKCRADCRSCQKMRDGHPISMDYMRENYDFEFADGSYESERENSQEQDRDDLLWGLVGELDPSDQQIIKLFNEGRTDAAIAEVLKKSRSMVQERRVKLVQLLKEKLKKHDE